MTELSPELQAAKAIALKHGYSGSPLSLVTQMIAEAISRGRELERSGK